RPAGRAPRPAARRARAPTGRSRGCAAAPPAAPPRSPPTPAPTDGAPPASAAGRARPPAPPPPLSTAARPARLPPSLFRHRSAVYAMDLDLEIALRPGGAPRAEKAKPASSRLGRRVGALGPRGAWWSPAAWSPGARREAWRGEIRRLSLKRLAVDVD